MVSSIKKIVSNRYFLLATLIFFLIQTSWFAFSIKQGIPADETYHHKFIQYYTERPLLSSPITADQGEHYFYLGDVQRVPSYLYHYLLSFPNRLIELFNISVELKIISLRLVNVLIGFFSLLTLRKIFLALKFSNFSTNLTLLALTLTGMFSWLSASINYDNLSLLLFFGFIYFLIKTLRYKDLNSLLITGSLAASSVITKVTVAPTVLLALIAALYFWFRDGEENSPERNRYSRLQTSVFAVLFILSVFLFSERILGNLISYQTVTPKCGQIHTVEQCLQNGIFKRDYDYAQVNDNSNRALSLGEVDIPGYTITWSNIMYDRLYFFFGHKTIPSNQSAENTKVALLAFVTLGLMFKSGSLVKNKYEKLLLIVTVFYVAQLFLFNLNAYTQKGAILGGYQGRYLLPILPFVYIFIIRALASVKHSFNRASLTIFAAVGLLTVAWFSYKHFPPYIFLKNTNSSWYTETSKDFNNNLRNKLIPEEYNR